jgi:hypothetical protein
MEIEVPIESVRDYEMFVKQRVNLMQISNKHKALVRKLVMAGFHDGIAFAANGGGKVTVKDK